MHAGERLFLAHGFSGTGTDVLCREAGVSKTSLYKFFGDMDGLLTAIVSRNADLLSVDVSFEPASRREFFDALQGYGANLLELVGRPEVLQLDRLIHEEARRHPEVARRYHEATYDRAEQEVAALLRHGARHGFIDVVPNARDAADHLLSMWVGMGYVRARLGLSERSHRSIRSWARQCVEALFPQARERRGDTDRSALP